MKRGRRIGLKWVVWLALALCLVSPAGAQEARHVSLLEVEGPVTPVMISYVERGIETAEREDAEALIVQLDTPGGQVDLMGEVVRTILDADVPVVVYVYPPGAYAASAGTLITLAGHVAAMAPGTTIGAASPVGGQGEDLGETMEQKLKEDLKAQARALTGRRGEAAVEWAESAIDEARAATADEALALGVVDFVAADVDDLLEQMDGLEIALGGEQVTLRTAEAEVREMPMTFFEQILHIVTNPTIAFILLTIGLNAIIFELSAPGGYAAGIIGAICLLLGFYALGVLPVNYTGLLFIVLAFVLFVVDVKASTFGVLTAGGIASLVVGAMILFNSPLYRVSISAVIAVAVVTGIFFAFAMTKVMRSRRQPSVTGREGLVGQVGEARTVLEPDGMVFVHGELWKATAVERPVARGERVEIVGVEGFRLIVQPVNPPE